MKKQALRFILIVTLMAFFTGIALSEDTPLEQARSLIADRQFDKAITLLKKEMKKSGQSADLLVVMADSYLALEKESKAEKFYRRALDLDPRHIDGNLNLGMLLVTIRERDEAIILIKSVLAENPDHAKAHYCLGMTYNARADIDDAFAQYKILKKLDKELAGELYNAIFSK